jgi:hypothetical protein
MVSDKSADEDVGTKENENNWKIGRLENNAMRSCIVCTLH